MATRDFLMMAAEPGALVDSQADYAGSGYQEDGFTPGPTLPTQFNKGFRQGTAGMAVLAQLIINILDVDVVDSGASEAAEVATLAAQLQTAIEAIAGSAGAPQVISVAYSATPAMNFAAGNPLFVVFEITLTGDAVPVFSGVTPGQRVTFIINQDGTGGHTWTWPAAVKNGGAIDPTASATSLQSFVVDAAGNLQADGGITG